MIKKAAAVFALILSAAFTISCAGYEPAASFSIIPAITDKTETCSSPEKTVSAENTASVSNTPQVSQVPAEIVSVSSMPQQASQIQIQRIVIKSSFLNKDMNANVYLPPNYDTSEKYPVLYFFHGYRGNQNDWEKNMGLVDSAYDLFSSGKIKPLIIVTPDIDNSYGINSALSPEHASAGTSAGFKPSYGFYEYYLIKELIPYIDSNYSTITEKEGRYIGGLSMGGFAALHLCFAHTDLFSKAGGHSPALWIYTKDPAKINDAIIWLYPSMKLREERDPLEQVKNADLSGIEIWLDCGTKDQYRFYAGTKKLYDILVSREVQVVYHSFSGRHNIDYWGAHIKEYLTFYGS